MISPRKLRLLADNIRKMSPVEALGRLKFTNTKAARIMIKALQNVIGVAAGDNKVNAIRAALKGQYLDILITDDNTASQLIKESHQ